MAKVGIMLAGNILKGGYGCEFLLKGETKEMRVVVGMI